MARSKKAKKHSPSPISVPEATLHEKAEELARAGAAAAAGAALPVVGDAVSAILGQLFPSVYKRRSETWRHEVTDALNQLAARGVDVEALRNNESFVDLVVDVTTTAIRSSSREKRVRLRNAILNSALPTTLSVAKQRMFLRFVDELDEVHIELLCFFSSPEQFFLDRHGVPLPRHNGPTGMMLEPASSNASLRRVLRIAFPGHAEQDPFLELAIADLERRGLLNRINLDEIVSSMGSYATAFGAEFLGFVSDPE